jgi:predicted N-formylglutamate amidohydrolase
LTEWKEDNQQGVAGVYSHFSRLYCDVNRPLGSPTMFRAEGDGRKVDLNVSISDAEKNKRISYCYIPYHEALHQLSLSHPNARLGLSLHSFTDNYEGQPRLTEIGVLYKDEEDRELCETLTKGLTASGYKAVVNDPWSGKDGFMFAAEKLKEAYMKRRKGSNAPYFHTIMFEFRQDLVMSKEWRKKVRQTIVNILQTQTNIFK